MLYVWNDRFKTCQLQLASMRWTVMDCSGSFCHSNSNKDPGYQKPVLQELANGDIDLAYQLGITQTPSLHGPCFTPVWLNQTSFSAHIQKDPSAKRWEIHTYISFILTDPVIHVTQLCFIPLRPSCRPWHKSCLDVLFRCVVKAIPMHTKELAKSTRI